MPGVFSVDSKGVCYPWVDTGKAVVGPVFSLVKVHLVFSVSLSTEELGAMATERTYAYPQLKNGDK